MKYWQSWLTVNEIEIAKCEKSMEFRENLESLSKSSQDKKKKYGRRRKGYEKI